MEEILEMVTAEVKRLMLQGGEEHRIRESLLRSGYLPMRAEAQRLIEEGMTDEAEVVRVLGTEAAVDASEEFHRRGDVA